MNLLDRLKSRAASSRPDFTGKVLAIYSISKERGGMFQEARLVRIGFSEFIVGRRIEKEPPARERWSNVEFWVAVHDIAQMLVFDNLEEAGRAYLGEESEGEANPTSPGDPQG